MKRVAVITGAGGGIGAALCAAFRSAGYRVIALEHPGVSLASRIAAPDVALTADLEAIVTDGRARADLVRAVLEAAGGDPIQVLVNNAATQRLGSTADASAGDLAATLAVNVTAPFLLVQGLLPALEKARGSVVNIGSVHATATKPGFVAYATSKSALSGLTRALAVDLGGRVRVNGIAPGAIATPMLEAGFEGQPKARAALAASHPMGRIGTPEEVAAAAVWLASEGAAFVTGAELAVDGGVSRRLHDPL
jgi:NAD(P)-dependent dehydrogenase (short-subunit alcohol dehydrogenase family)